MKLKKHDKYWFIALGGCWITYFVGVYAINLSVWFTLISPIMFTYIAFETLKALRR